MSDLLLFSAGATNQWLHSVDDGVTWSAVAGATTPPQGAGNFVTNGLTIFPDGTWLLMQRDAGSSSIHHFFTSPDGGATWAEAAGSPDTFGSTSWWAEPDLGIQLQASNDSRSLIISSDRFNTVTNVTLPNFLLQPDNGWGWIIRTPAGRFASIWRDGGNDNHAAYSDDGISWTFTTNAYPGNGSGGVNDKAASLHYNPGAGVVVGASPGPTYSIIQDTDGSGDYSIVFSSANGPFSRAFMAQPIPPNASMAANLALFVTSASSAYAVTTTNGIAWTDAGLTNLVGFPAGFQFRFLYQTGTGAWLLSAANGPGTASLYRSSDGVNWTVIPSAAGDVLSAMAQLS